MRKAAVFGEPRVQFNLRTGADSRPGIGVDDLIRMGIRGATPGTSRHCRRRPWRVPTDSRCRPPVMP